ncbi:hypothetical protein [Brevundimonas sp.]|uniref:hypothetical protein n=1 Tax=Brevundimonas sp. TaxID=1871086 RepID=UPI003BA8B70D
MHQTQRAKEQVFFSGMAVLAIVVSAIGFSTTFIAPIARGAFAAPAVVHLHAVLFIAWLLLLLTQARLVAGRRLNWHRKLGLAGAALAIAMAASGIGVGLFAAHRDLAAGQGTFAEQAFLTVWIEMGLFLALVVAGIVQRNRPDVHKRLMLLATITILGPAWFRFRHLFPGVENPLVVFSIIADSLVLFAMAADQMIWRRVNPVYWKAGLAMIAVHVGEVTLFGTAPFAAVAHAVARLSGLTA